MQTIEERLAAVRAQINDACRDCGRQTDEVRLLAVSKTQSKAAVESARLAGQQDFGENYLQEAIDKVDSIPEATWHFIGAIQSNKTRDIAARFDWVHSVASAKVAKRLSDQRPGSLSPLKVLVQVNISEEPQKSGINPDRAAALIDEILTNRNIEVRGLMAIPSPSNDPLAQQVPFDQLRSLRDTIAQEKGLESFDQLSMGMSADFAIAIASGATWIRIGTAIFGPRQQKERQ